MEDHGLGFLDIITIKPRPVLNLVLSGESPFKMYFSQGLP